MEDLVIYGRQGAAHVENASLTRHVHGGAGIREEREGVPKRVDVSCDRVGTKIESSNRRDRRIDQRHQNESAYNEPPVEMTDNCL